MSRRRVLTDAQIAEARRRREIARQNSIKAIARDFGVSKWTLQNVLCYRHKTQA